VIFAGSSVASSGFSYCSGSAPAVCSGWDFAFSITPWTRFSSADFFWRVSLGLQVAPRPQVPARELLKEAVFFPIGLRGLVLIYTLFGRCSSGISPLLSFTSGFLPVSIFSSHTRQPASFCRLFVTRSVLKVNWFFVVCVAAVIESLQVKPSCVLESPDQKTRGFVF
jgi:hypothetical protein